VKPAQFLKFILNTSSQLQMTVRALCFSVICWACSVT